MAKLFFSGPNGSAFNTNGSARTTTDGGTLTNILPAGDAAGILVHNAARGPVSVTLTCGPANSVITQDSDDLIHGRSYPIDNHKAYDIEGNVITVHLEANALIRFEVHNGAQTGSSITVSDALWEGHTLTGLQAGHNYVSILRYQ